MKLAFDVQIQKPSDITSKWELASSYDRSATTTVAFGKTKRIPDELEETTGRIAVGEEATAEELPRQEPIVLAVMVRANVSCRLRRVSETGAGSIPDLRILDPRSIQDAL